MEGELGDENLTGFFLGEPERDPLERVKNTSNVSSLLLLFEDLGEDLDTTFLGDFFGEGDPPCCTHFDPF